MQDMTAWFRAKDLEKKNISSPDLKKYKNRWNSLKIAAKSFQKVWDSINPYWEPLSTN